MQIINTEQTNSFCYKIWCQNSPSGYLIAFKPYQGKGSNFEETLETNHFGKCAATVIQLLKHYSAEKIDLPYTLYCDNIFTTLPLLLEMEDRGYNCVGTIKANRVPKECKLSGTKQMSKKPRGVFECVMGTTDEVKKVYLTLGKI